MTQPLKKYFLLLVALLCLGVANAQEAQKDTVIEESQVRKVVSKTVFLNGNRYKSPNSWITAGVGVGYKFNSPTLVSSPIGVNYNFHLLGNYFQLGYMRSELAGILSASGEMFMNDFHLGAGMRRETIKNNVAAFAGVSRVGGQYNDSTGFALYGVYAEVQYTYKFFYDVGLGATLFTNINYGYRMMGLRLEFYFSNAYKGKQPKP